MKTESSERNEKRFRRLLEASSQIIWIADAKGNIIEDSPSWRAFTGLTFDKLAGWNWKSSIHPDDRQRLEEAWRKSIKTVTPCIVEFMQMNASGEYRSMFGTAVPIFDENGSVVEWIGMNMDVTERKKIEEALKESEERFRTLFEELPLSTVVFQKVGNDFIIKDYNQASMKFTDNKMQDFIGKSASKLYESSPDVLEKIKLAVENRTTQKIQRKYRMMSTGKDIFLNLTLAYVPPDKIIMHSEDITEMKKSEEKLLETSNYLESLLNYANASIIVWDTNFKITRFNNAFERLTGRSKDEVIGKELDILFPSDKKEEIMKLIKHTAIERWEIVEIPILDTDGEVRTVLWNSANIYDADGKVINTIAQGQDITERKQAEEEIVKSLKEKELLLKEIHHRVKNNIQMISSLLHLQSFSANEESFEILKESQNRIKSIGLVHEILYETNDFSNVNSSRYLKELVRRILNIYESKKILVKFDIDEISLKINTAIPCGLITNEIVINSIKHAFPQNKGNINISLHAVGGNNELTISDDGVGMPANLDLDNIKSLGLKLVKSLTEQLEGKMEYKNDKGTIFKITFPNK